MSRSLKKMTWRIYEMNILQQEGHPFECGKEKAFDTTCDKGEGDLGGQIEMNILQQEGYSRVGEGESHL
jgi:hypothetical protein